MRNFSSIIGKEYRYNNLNIKRKRRRTKKYHELTEHKFEDEDIYNVMVRFNNDDDLIKNELKEMIKETLRGDEYNWQRIGESKYIQN